MKKANRFDSESFKVDIYRVKKANETSESTLKPDGFFFFL